MGVPSRPECIVQDSRTGSVYAVKYTHSLDWHQQKRIGARGHHINVCINRWIAYHDYGNPTGQCFRISTELAIAAGAHAPMGDDQAAFTGVE
jgi:hypothetical protein